MDTNFRYLPLRIEVWKFLHAIRDWLFELGPVTLAGDEFSSAIGIFKFLNSVYAWLAF